MLSPSAPTAPCDSHELRTCPNEGNPRFHGEVDRSRIVIALITTDEAEEVATDAESLFLHPNVPVRCAFNNFRSVFGVPFFANLCYRPPIITYHVENEWHPAVRRFYHGQLSLMCRLARASFTNPFPFANNHPLKVDIPKLHGLCWCRSLRTPQASAKNL